MDLIMSDMLSELVITERRSMAGRVATFEACHERSRLMFPPVSVSNVTLDKVNGLSALEAVQFRGATQLITTNPSLEGLTTPVVQTAMDLGHFLNDWKPVAEKALIYKRKSQKPTRHAFGMSRRQMPSAHADPCGRLTRFARSACFWVNSC
jgi:hypothetical protein